MRTALTLMTLALLCSPGHAWSDMERITAATNIGSVVGSESVCNLAYDPQAVQALIAAQVPADDMEFASTMNMMAQGTAYQFQSMTPAQKTAHCAQIERVARSYKLIN